MSKNKRSAALLAGEKEYMETLAERLSIRHGWDITVAGEVSQKVREADLIAAESLWISALKDEPGLLDKTVFFMEEEVDAGSGNQDVFPRMIHKYGGFRNIERELCDAMDSLRGKEETFRGKAAPVIILGAWDGGESRSRQIAEELARRMDATVLYLGLERFPGKREDEGAQDGTSCGMEDLLYYALDRMEMDGCCREDSVRAVLSLSGDVCFLPECFHINPLWELEREEWQRLLPVLCTASRAQTVLLWTGREELTRCGGFRGLTGQCVYLRPEKEGPKWNRFNGWLMEEGSRLIGTEIRLADSWTELLRMVVEFHADVA